MRVEEMWNWDSHIELKSSIEKYRTEYGEIEGFNYVIKAIDDELYFIENSIVPGASYYYHEKTYEFFILSYLNLIKYKIKNVKEFDPTIFDVFAPVRHHTYDLTAIEQDLCDYFQKFGFNVKNLMSLRQSDNFDFF
jgi:hypothetical protein